LIKFSITMLSPLSRIANMGHLRVVGQKAATV
jgi:hypothetical protein